MGRRRTETLGERLEGLRLGRGLSQEKLAALTDGVVAQADVSRIEKGVTEEPGPSKLRALAKALGVSVALLVEGELAAHVREENAPYETTEEVINEGSGPESVTVPVKGYVGAGEEVHYFEDQAAMDYVEPPNRPGAEESVAVIVRGDSMEGRYDEGTLLFYFPADHVASDCIGRMCVVQVLNGPLYIKRLRRGRKRGLYRLVSQRGQEMDDVELEWAARVRWTEEP